MAGTFPTKRTTRGLAATSSSVRANLPTDTGAGDIGAAVGSVGGQLLRSKPNRRKLLLIWEEYLIYQDSHIGPCKRDGLAV